MALPMERTAEQTDGAVPQPPHRRRPPSAAEQARRRAWGKQAGAKVRAAYRELTLRGA